MNANTKRWLPIALCCLPGVAVAAVVGLGVAAGGTAFGASFGGPLGLGLIALVMLACPISMALMMRRGSKQNTPSGSSSLMVDCCLPGEQAARVESDRLATLRARREALEREVAELQAGRGG